MCVPGCPKLPLSSQGNTAELFSVIHRNLRTQALKAEKGFNLFGLGQTFLTFCNRTKIQETLFKAPFPPLSGDYYSFFSK